jgi:hypothetical protein
MTDVGPRKHLLTTGQALIDKLQRGMLEHVPSKLLAEGSPEKHGLTRRQPLINTAQRGGREHVLCKQGVASSNLAVSTSS